MERNNEVLRSYRDALERLDEKQTVFSNGLDLYHKPSVPGESEYKPTP